MTLAASNAIYQGAGVLGNPTTLPHIVTAPVFDHVTEIARKIAGLSYGDMKKLSAEIYDILLINGRDSFADGLNEWAEKRISHNIVMASNV